MPASWEDESVVHSNDAVLSQLNHAWTHVHTHFINNT